MYFEKDKEDRFPRICAMGNPKAANEMIVALAAGYLAGGHCDMVDMAIKDAAAGVERMLEEITGEDERPMDLDKPLDSDLLDGSEVDSDTY
jgi:hypothetical protein